MTQSEINKLKMDNDARREQLEGAVSVITDAIAICKSIPEIVANNESAVLQNYLSLISIAVNCKEFTGGAPIPISGKNVELSIIYNGTGYFGISVQKGMDIVKKYSATEDDLTPKTWDQIYRISGQMLAKLMYDHSMVMHDPKTYKEV